MRTPERNMPHGNDTVEEKLTTCVQALLGAAGRLKSALVARNADAIWDALGEQEEQAGLLNEYSALWQQVTAAGRPTTDDDLERRRLRLEIRRLQALQRANSMLAQSFLSAIRKTIDSVTNQATKTTGATYSKLGRRRSSANSGLVRRFG